MEYNRQNNIITIKPKENFFQIVAYLYLMVLEFVSQGIFVPSLNPPEDNDFSPNDLFFNKEHTLIYKKKVIFNSSYDEITLNFETIEDATYFFDELEKTW